jgi:hypothetical protein
LSRSRAKASHVSLLSGLIVYELTAPRVSYR